MTPGSQELAITWDWEAAPSVRLKEHQITWARLEIWVSGEYVTLVEDLNSQSSRRSLYCPLYPLAEWIAYNWWLLRADSRPTMQLGDFSMQGVLAIAGSSNDGLRRHNLRSVGDGFLWPDLLIVPEGRTTRLVWGRDTSIRPGQGIRFLSRGERVLDREVVLHALSSFVEAVLTRLAEQGANETLLEREWRAIGETDAEEESFCLAAARLGLDPYAEGLDVKNEILGVADKLHGRVYEDFLNAVNPEAIVTGLNWVSRGARTIESHRGQGTNRTARLRDALRGAANGEVTQPWRVGYAQAQEVRSALQIPVGTALYFSELILARKRLIDDRGLQAVGGTANGGQPLVILGRPYRTETERFTLARGLWHALFEDDSLFLVTSAYTERQRVERAFAAELLAPAEGIWQRLAGVSEIGIDDVEAVARHFRVAPVLVQHQLENQPAGRVNE